MGVEQGEGVGIAQTVDGILPVATQQHSTEAETKQLLPRSGRDTNKRPLKLKESGGKLGTVCSSIRAILIALLHIGFSAGVILLNKYTLSPKRFPYAVLLTTLQVACGFVFGKLLSTVAPGLFPSAQTILAKRKYVQNDIAAWAFLPIAFCSALAMTSANSAYLYAPVSFLQIAKEPVVVWVYLLTVMLGLERISFRNVFMLGIVLITATFAITNAQPFAWAGFYLQLLSSVAQATQAVLTSRLMTRAMGLKVDPLSMMMVCSPVVLLLLLPFNLMLFDKVVALQLVASWRLLCLNVISAFALQLINAITLRELSATGLCFAAVLKDFSIVALAVILLQESLTQMQLVGFVGCVFAVALYAFVKIHPHIFERTASSSEP